MLVYQETLFDRYHCIKSLCHLKTLEKTPFKFFFVLPIMAHKNMKDSRI